MTKTHAHLYPSPKRIEELLDTLGDLGHMKYADVVKPNPKKFRCEAWERHEYVREGHTVRDCARRLLEDERQLNHFAEKGKPDPAAYLVQKVIDDTKWDTEQGHSYGVLYRLVRK
jgi:hypothetical protein